MRDIRSELKKIQGTGFNSNTDNLNNLQKLIKAIKALISALQ